jgi:group II intron reverse transcriptase/maturase
VDGLTWPEYEDGLDDRLVDLHRRVHTGTYRAQPSKRAYLPKPDGGKRPLGIAALEDKIVPQAVVTVLNQIDEVDFLGFSYGFRPGRSAQEALDARWVGIMGKKGNWVLDADLQSFFDTIALDGLVKFLEHRIADRRLLRLIQKWLRAGVSEDGQWTKSAVGTPQGAGASPWLAKVFRPYVFDLWVQHGRTKFATGAVIVVRYADDFLVGFPYRREAEQFLRELRERLGQFGLGLHPDQTRLIEFGRFAASDRQRRGQGKPETFDFLGFTHYGARKRQSGGFYVRRKTVRKRLRAKLHAVQAALLRRRPDPLAQPIVWLQGVVRGYFNYHAIPGNRPALETFRRETVRAWLQALRRRRQRSRLSWARFGPLTDRCIPRPQIRHPHPNDRFYAQHPK